MLRAIYHFYKDERKFVKFFKQFYILQDQIYWHLCVKCEDNRQGRLVTDAFLLTDFIISLRLRKK